MIELRIENLNLVIEEPQWVMIQGEDSDRLKEILDILSGKTKVEVGRYLFEGIDTDTFSQRQLAYFRKKDAINISDSTFLMGDFTVEKNLQMQLKSSGIYPTKGKRMIDKVLMEFNLKDLKDIIVSALTPLQQLQVKVVKSMVVEPKLICGFSPFSNLQQEETRVLIEWINMLVEKGTSVVLVTTDSKDLDYGDVKINY